MTEPPDEGTAPEVTPPGPDPASRRDVLFTYFWSNRDRYTEAALSKTAADAGFLPDEISTAAAEVARRRQDEVAAARPQADGLATFLAILAVLAAVLAYGGSGLLAGIGLLAGGGVVLVLYLIGMIVAGTLTIRAAWRVRARATNAAVAVLGVAAVSTVAFLAMSGICLATWGGLNL